MPSRRLPIFPLNIVLFPGTPQLLHIFEPRYQAMLADCLADDRMFGISFVEAGTTLDPVPEPGSVGCTALIQDTRSLGDGRSNILTVGAERYMLSGWETTDHPYRVARVELFDDDTSGSGSPELERNVRTACARLSEALRTLQDEPGEPGRLPDDPKALSFHVAAVLPVDPATKQALLAMRSTDERLDREYLILRHVNDDLAGRAAVHRDARGNGKGGPNPDIARSEP